MTGRRRDVRTPPRLAGWIVARVLPRASRAAVRGDLDERYRARLARDGAGPARRWYWRQTAGFLLQVPAARTRPAPEAGVRLRASGLGADVRFAARSLRRRPGFATTAVLILALAVGANTTVFSVVHAILVERLPFPEPERLVMLWDVYAPDAAGTGSPITLDHYQAWAAQTDLFSAVGAYESVSIAIEQGEWLERLDGAVVTSSLFTLLGARAAHGRLFTPADEAPGAPPVVVLSHGLWVARYGGDPSIVGREIGLNGRRTRVIGVTSEDFWFYDPYAAVRSFSGHNAEAARLWQPLAPDGLFEGETDYPRYRVVARLADGVTADTATAIAVARRRALPPTSAGSTAELRMVPLTEQVVAEARPRLLGLLAAVAVVLLIACVNLISLLLVHLESRRAELAVRASLGAGRARLVRQLVVESTALALAGGAAGLVLAQLATSWLLNLVPRGLPLAHRVGLDLTVAAFGVGLALLAGVAIGLAAGLRIDPRQLAGSMSAGQRTMAGTRGGRRLHGALIATEVALSLVLLIGATLLVRSLVQLHGTDTGFDARGVLTFQASVSVDPSGRISPEFFDALQSRVRALPGVVAVGGTSALPFSRWAQSASVQMGGGPMGDGAPRVDLRFATPGYFDAIGLGLRAGRVFESGDVEGTRLVAVVNEAFVARHLEQGVNPIGRVVTMARGRWVSTHTIVGVVANVKHSRLFEPARPILYVSARQDPLPFERFVVRVASGDPLALVEPIRRAAAAIDRRRPLDEFITFEALVAQSIEEERFYTQVLAAFAASAVLLTLVGIYGVVSFATRQRDREVGIRMALGAGAGRVQRLVLRQGLAPVTVGLLLGCAAGWLASGVLGSLLHDVPAQDPFSFGAATVLFALVAAAACLVPARRAARLDPVRVLRGA